MELIEGARKQIETFEPRNFTAHIHITFQWTRKQSNYITSYTSRASFRECKLNYLITFPGKKASSKSQSGCVGANKKKSFDVVVWIDFIFSNCSLKSLSRRRVFFYVRRAAALESFKWKIDKLAACTWNSRNANLLYSNTEQTRRKALWKFALIDSRLLNSK